MSEAFDKLIEQRRQQQRRSDGLQRWLFIGLIIIGFVLILYIVLRGDPAKRPVNPNTATVEELITLPEVGPDLAQKIKAGGPYAKPEDLLNVKGIGPKTLEKMRPRLKFE